MAGYHWVSQYHIIISPSAPLRITGEGRTPPHLREQMAVDALEPGGVLLFRETFNLHHVHLAAVAGVGERNLFIEIRHESQRLQVTVELRHFGHGDAVGEPHLVRHAGELPVCCERFHSLGQTSTETESCSARSEPETQPRL